MQAHVSGWLSPREVFLQGSPGSVGILSIREALLQEEALISREDCLEQRLAGRNKRYGWYAIRVHQCPAWCVHHRTSVLTSLRLRLSPPCLADLKVSTVINKKLI